jgi:hypothetical protein
MRPAKVSARHNLRIGDATANIRERRQQHARINTLSDLRRRQRADYIRQTAGF